MLGDDAYVVSFGVNPAARAFTFGVFLPDMNVGSSILFHDCSFTGTLGLAPPLLKIGVKTAMDLKIGKRSSRCSSFAFSSSFRGSCTR